MRLRYKHFLLALASLVTMGLASCLGGGSQFSGIVSSTRFDTIACVPQEKTLIVRNTDMSRPQRIQGVHFELGTNSDGYFKLVEVESGGQVFAASGDLVEEVILPAGGSMAMKVVCNPKELTIGRPDHNAVLDVVMNGPKLGVMQIDLYCRATQILAGCGEVRGEVKTFKVTEVKSTFSYAGPGPNHMDEPTVTRLNLDESVGGDFIFGFEGDKVFLPKDGWPTITFQTPSLGVPIVLHEDAEGSFVNGALSVVINVRGNGIPFDGLTLTTGAVDIDSNQAPHVAGNGISLQGSALSEAGDMTLVIGTALNDDGPDGLFASQGINGGAFGLEITLKQK